MWTGNFSKLCWTSRHDRKPILALILKDDSTESFKLAARSLSTLSVSVQEQIQFGFHLIAFSMSSVPINEFNHVFKMGNSELTFLFAHVTF